MVNIKNMANTELDPEILDKRDKIIEKIGNKSLDEVNIVIKKLLNEQIDETTRLAALAARVMIIRKKIENLYENKENVSTNNKKKNPEILKDSNQSNKKEVVKQAVDQNKKIEIKEEWIRIQLLEPTEVNQKNVDKDVVLDVKLEEGKKLIELKKAIKVEPEINEKVESGIAKEKIQLEKNTEKSKISEKIIENNDGNANVESSKKNEEKINIEKNTEDKKINDEVSNEKKIDEIKTKEQNQDLSSGSIKSEEENLEMKPLVESRGKNESKEKENLDEDNTLKESIKNENPTNNSQSEQNNLTKSKKEEKLENNNNENNENNEKLEKDLLEKHKEDLIKKEKNSEDTKKLPK